MHRHRFVKVKISALFLRGEGFREKVDGLEDIRLLDKAGAQHLVPGPVLVDGTLLFGDRVRRQQLFLHKKVVLFKDLFFLAVREIHFFRDIPPFLPFLFIRRAGEVQFFEPFKRIFQGPCCHKVGVIIVVDVVFIFIRPGYAQNHIALFPAVPRDAAGPEAAELHENFHAAVLQVVGFSGKSGVLVDDISNGAVAVDFLKRNLPFIMAFVPVHGYHWVKGALKPQLFRILFRHRQLAVPV